VLSAIAETFRALRELHKLPALIGRLLERRMQAIDPAIALARRVTTLEHELDDVEALAREVNVSPRHAEGAS
jgi:uncharacterized protein Yka (UPF0111/DUF47 family)